MLKIAHIPAGGGTVQALRRFKPVIKIFTIVLLMCLHVGCDKSAPSNGNSESGNVAIKETHVTSNSPDFGIQPPKRKVFLLGLDGLTWKMIDPLLRSGELPNMAKIINNGSWGTLKSTERPMWSPRIWTTVVTGVPPEMHGITKFFYRLPGSNEILTPVSSLRKTRALWNILSIKNRTTYALNWWASWPAESINGVIVTDRFPEDPQLEDIYPPAQREELLSMISEGKDKQLREFVAKYITADVDGFLKLEERENLKEGFGTFRNFLESDKRIMDITLGLMDKKPFPDLFLSYLRGTDVIAHRFFGYYPPFGKNPKWIQDENIKGMLGKMLPGYYRHADRFLGEIIDRLPEDAVLFVISDHGFQYKERGLLIPHINKLLEQMGYLKFDSDGEIDFSQTMVYDLSPDPRNWIRQLFINWDKPGRMGVVKPGDGERIIFELAKKLSNVRSEDKTIFPKIIIPEAEGKPDLVVHFDGKALGKTVEFEGQMHEIEFLVSVKQFTGRHHVDGVIMVFGPGVKSSFKMNDHSVNDICKTLLFLQGFPVGKDMLGDVIRDCWSDAEIKSAQVKTIPSYGTIDRKITKTVEKSKLHDKKLKELRSLGYVE